MRFLTLDATGTLLRPRARIGATYLDHWQRVAPAFLASQRQPSDAQLVDQRFVAAFRHHSQLTPNFGRATGSTTAESWWSDVILDALPPHLTAGLSTASKRELTSSLYAYYGTGEAWQVFDEVKHTLATLHSKGVKMAVISDFDERLPGILRGVELDEFFSVVTTSWAFGESKPAPRIFLHTFHQLAQGEADASWFLHVGDHQRRDYEGAIAAGANSRLLVRDVNAIGQSDVALSDVNHSLDDLVTFF